MNNFKETFLDFQKKNKVLFVITLLSSLIDSIYPYIMIVGLSLIISNFLAGNSNQLLLTILIVLIVELICRALSAFCNFIFQYRKKKYDEKMRADMYKNILNMPYALFIDNEEQRKIEMAENAYRYSGGYSPFVDCLKSLFQAFFGILFGIGILLFKVGNIKNPPNRITLLIYCLITFLLLLCGVFLEIRSTNQINEKIKKMYDDVMDKENQMSYFLFKVFNDYSKGKSIRLNRLSDLIMSKYSSLFSSTIPNNLTMTSLNCRIRFIPETIAAIMNGIICLFSVLFVVFGFFDISYLILVVGSVSGINSAVPLIIREKKNMARYLQQQMTYQSFENEVQGDIPEIQNRGKQKLEKIHTIAFENVSYIYPNSKIEALKNINCSLTIEGIHTIIGRNGSGKTTFIKLLLGLLKPTTGRILVNGYDINELDFGSYRNKFRVVFQDFNLYATSIANNISCSNTPDYSKVMAVIESSSLNHFTDNLQEALNTDLFSYDESGIEMSGGEMQKIAIARGKYKEADIWVMDEPTSALDPISEEAIFNELHQSTKNTPCIYISHRMSSCTYSDEIILLDEGRVISIGSHSDLLSKSELYKQMWYEQVAYL